MSEPCKGHILIADDDERYLRLIRVNLEASGYTVIAAQTGQSALELTASAEPDLVLLDIMMPELNGYTVCQKIREFSNVPIIMLTALAETENLIDGLDAGADDYVTKPVSVKELLARVRAALRRSQLDQVEYTPSFETGSLRVDFVGRRVYVHGEEVNLTQTEYRLLKELVTQAERVVTPAQLLEKIWGPGYENSTQLIWQAIHRLRHKIAPTPDTLQHIQTRPGIGYIFTLDGSDNGE